METGPAARRGKARRHPHESKLYAEYSRVYEKIFAPLLEKRIHAVIKSLHIPPGATVLEVGIGTGLSM